MTETFTATEFKVMAVVASEIAPGHHYNLSDLRSLCFRRHGIHAIDFNLAIKKLSTPWFLQVTSMGMVSIRPAGWDWISANRDKLVRIVGTR